MNRRDFLLLRSDRGRAMELSCQRLYMWYLDTQVTHAGRELPQDAEPGPWDGEPPAVFVTRTINQLFQDFERDLREVELLRIRDCEWLIHEEMAREVDTLVTAFRQRGGRVEFLD